MRGFAADVEAGEVDPVARAAWLFEAARDGFWSDPFHFSPEPPDHIASAVLAAGRAWCVPKAVLWGTVDRVVGNDLPTPRLKSLMNGIDLSALHGFTVLRLEDR
jgi:hypothetical protein